MSTPDGVENIWGIDIPLEVVSGNFSHWEINAVGNPYVYDSTNTNFDINLVSDVTIIAYFDWIPPIQPDTITFMMDPIGQPNPSENNGNIITHFPFTETYMPNDVISLSAVPNTGWQLNYWSSNNHVFTPNPTASNTSIIVNSSDTIFWLYLEPIVVTATMLKNPSNSQGEVYIDGELITLFPYSKSYDYGSTVNISAISNTSWEFTDWSSKVHVPNGTNSSSYIALQLMKMIQLRQTSMS